MDMDIIPFCMYCGKTIGGLETMSFCDAPASPSLGFKRAVKRRCLEDPTPPKVTAQSVATAALGCFSSMPKQLHSNVRNENNILQLMSFMETSCHTTASNHIQPQPSIIPARDPQQRCGWNWDKDASA